MAQAWWGRTASEGAHFEVERVRLAAGPDPKLRIAAFGAQFPRRHQLAPAAHISERQGCWLGRAQDGALRPTASVLRGRAATAEGLTPYA